MTTLNIKSHQSRGKHPSVSGRSKPKGKGFLSLTEYKRAKRAELDKFKKACGG